MFETGLARRRHCFVIETQDAADALIRVLTPFAVQRADLVGVVLTRADAGLAIRIEADGLDALRAETLLRRLAGMPIVRSVGFGWRGLEQAAA